jgi:hypothetical protein
MGGWGFELRPHNLNGYCAAAMEEYIRSWPVYQRSDGVWVFCNTYERRNEVIEEGTIDVLRYRCGTFVSVLKRSGSTLVETPNTMRCSPSS